MTMLPSRRILREIRPFKYRANIIGNDRERGVDAYWTNHRPSGMAASLN